jgi:hypothetical protein
VNPDRVHARPDERLQLGDDGRDLGGCERHFSPLSQPKNATAARRRPRHLAERSDEDYFLPFFAVFLAAGFFAAVFFVAVFFFGAMCSLR